MFFGSNYMLIIYQFCIEYQTLLIY